MTVRQPWTTSILHGDKRGENRSRPWVVGWYLLHAGAAIDRAPLRDPLAARTIRRLELATRAVLGVVRITGSHTDTPGQLRSPRPQPGRVHLDLDDIHPLPLPVPCDDRLGPWRVPHTVLTQVITQLPRLDAVSFGCYQCCMSLGAV